MLLFTNKITVNNFGYASQQKNYDDISDDELYTIILRVIFKYVIFNI